MELYQDVMYVNQHITGSKYSLHASKSVNMTENITIEKHSEEVVHMTLMRAAKQLDEISTQDILVMEP